MTTRTIQARDPEPGERGYITMMERRKSVERQQAILSPLFTPEEIDAIYKRGDLLVTLLDVLHSDGKDLVAVEILRTALEQRK